jgi:hypothetical protein
MADWRQDRVASALRGENPLVMARMRAGFAVIGDTQHLPGYSLLLTDDPTVDHLTDLDWPRRAEFLFDFALLGEAVERGCRPLRLAGSTTRSSVTRCRSSTDMFTRGTNGSRQRWPADRFGGIRRMSATTRPVCIPTRDTATSEPRSLPNLLN